ncbi:MAG: response regulator [Eubacterium sp.]|jgi:DNA-binding NarL/FixJ family response regulator|nr:response regulator [Eubacterium sp.]
MKYKALLTGKNNSVIDDFFVRLGDDFEVLTTSIRYEDIIKHVQYFSPDVMVYCIYNEKGESLSQMTNIKYQLQRAGIPFILIGSKEDCEEFQRVAVNVSDLILLKPLTADAIKFQITNFMRGWKTLQQKSNVKTEKASDGKTADAADNDVEEVKRKHILVVDDSPIMLKTLKEHLRDTYDIATAVSGKVAMKFLERKKTDLILLDYEMPEESGPVVLEKLRANQNTKDIPVIFLTGVTDSGKIKEALVLKPQGYLLKPIDHGKLIESIENVIG